MSEQTTQITTEEKQPTAPSGDSISLNDLSVLLTLVDLSAERGTFKGSELSQVGAVRDKLAAFLSSVAEAQAAAQQVAEQEAAPTGE